MRPTDRVELLKWATERCLLEHFDTHEAEALTLVDLNREVDAAAFRIEMMLEHEAGFSDRQLRDDAVDEYIEGRTPWVEPSREVSPMD